MRAGLGVTFVGHDASRTGAPIVLRSLLRWAHRNTDDRVDVVLRRGGPLVADYRSFAPVLELGSAALDLAGGARRAAASVGLPAGPVEAAERLVLRHRARRLGASDVVVANTLASLGTALALAGDAPVVCHVHELDHVAARVLGARDRPLLDRVAHFVATGDAVRRMLCERWAIDEGRVTVIDAFIDEPRPAAEAVRAARRALGEPDRPVVLSVGALGHRKGPEQFVDLLAALSDHPSRPMGVWLGGELDGPAAAELRADVARAGLEGSFRLLGAVEDPLPYVAAADVVVSTAREDPFPLSLLEAAALGRPVVSSRSGGLAEALVGWQGPSHVVDVGDVLAMASVVGRLLDDPDGAGTVGAASAAAVRASHLTEQLAPVLWDTIRGLAASNGASAR